MNEISQHYDDLHEQLSQLLRKLGLKDDEVEVVLEDVLLLASDRYLQQVLFSVPDAQLTALMSEIEVTDTVDEKAAIAHTYVTADTALSEKTPVFSSILQEVVDGYLALLSKKVTDEQVELIQNLRSSMDTSRDSDTKATKS